MKTLLIAIPLGLLTASPAYATGGFVCRTAGSRALQVSVGFGHTSGSQLLEDATRLTDKGRNVPVVAPQWWFDGSELRLLLTDPSALRREAIVKARRTGRTFDGSLWRGGKRYWVRCREA
ncbi:MAG TPA: hypothetical protein VM145_04220 [Sphingomicrobium sp.]|nr:hypothetical protein [Sphingomicrobium sp.]